MQLLNIDDDDLDENRNMSILDWIVSRIFNCQPQLLKARSYRLRIIQ